MCHITSLAERQSNTNGRQQASRWCRVHCKKLYASELQESGFLYQDTIDESRFTFRAGFKDCQLQYASFHGLNLLGTRFDRFQMEEVDFADCTTARGYIINPNNNRLSHAKFFAVQSG